MIPHRRRVRLPLRPIEAFPLEVLVQADMHLASETLFGPAGAHVRCRALGTLALPSRRIRAYDPMIATVSGVDLADDRELPDTCTVWLSELEMESGEGASTRVTAALAAGFVPDEPVIRWVPAERKHGAHFPVDSECFALMDASVVGQLEALTRRESENVYEKVCDAIDRASGSMEAVGLPPAFVCRSGSGRYRCWWGEDEDARTVAFLVQFDAIDVIEQLLVDGPELVETYFDDRIS